MWNTDYRDFCFTRRNPSRYPASSLHVIIDHASNPLIASNVLNWPIDSTSLSLTMKCPKCETETLGEFFVKRVAVDRCSSCNGIWFDARELSELLTEDARQVAMLRRGGENEQRDGKRGKCPRDGAELLRIYSSIDHSVVLDACADCHGIWLDTGEFQKLFAARQA